MRLHPGCNPNASGVRLWPFPGAREHPLSRRNGLQFKRFPPTKRKTYFGAETRETFVASEVLYQLSYVGLDG
jgi:hypothetical protein